MTSAFAREVDVEMAILDALAHEGQGHYGIRAMHGNDMQAVDTALRELFASIGGVAGVRRIAAKNGIDMSLYLQTAAGMNERARAGYLVDELLAHLQGRAATAGLTQRALAAIKAYLGAVREWLRNHGFSNLAKGSDADIALLLKRMREASMRRPTGRGLAARFARSDSTRAAYERRIDELFAGAEPGRQGVTVLDRSDVLDLLGHGDLPVVLHERHAIGDGKFNHPLTAEQWKRIPSYLENPVAVFERGDGNMTFVTEELVGGKPLIIGVAPNASPAKSYGEPRHLLLTAFVRDRGALPVARMIRDGELRFVDTRKSPGFSANSGLHIPSRGAELRGLGRKVHTGAGLFKCRRSEGASSAKTIPRGGVWQ